MSLEAVSRGFRVISFEKDKRTALAIKDSFKSLKLTPELYIGDTLKNLLKVTEKADVIFIDPPYESDLYEKTLKLIAENNLLNKNGIIILEHPISKTIDYCGFELLKTKTYGDKQITYLK